MKAKRKLPEGIDFVQQKGGVREYRLVSNDLRILHREEKTAPVVMVMVTFHVGSRNEAAGHTGATHILEHLLFKGSKKFNRKNGKLSDILLSRIGAKLNATTWMDRTNYWEVVAKEHADLALAIEADRLRGALFSADDLKSEMTVVRNEFERGKNDPMQILDEELWATAFHAHPYHHPTIGWKSDIENVPVGRLREFYDTFYWPNNATLTLLGDISEDRALRLSKKYFGSIPKAPHNIPQVYTVEPPQEGPRFVEIRREGQTTNLIGIAHKIPKGLSADTYPLQVLSKILAGGKGSRLYKMLVDKGLASEVFVFDFAFHDPGLYITYAYLTRGAKHEDAQRIIEKEFEAIAKAGPTNTEVERAKQQLLVELSFLRDGIYQEGSVLNEAIAMGDWTFFATFFNQVKSVTRGKVQRAAAKYLVATAQTTGHFIGTGV